MDYAQLSNEPTLLEKCQEIATNATWGIKLGRLKVNDGLRFSPERNGASICHHKIEINMSQKTACKV